MKLNKIIRPVFVFTIVVAIALGCSNRINSSASRAYHELNTRYNIYHNAQKTYTQLLEDQLSPTSINWFELLTIHPQQLSTDKTIPGGQFDGVIDKTAKSIIEHSITSKPKRNPSKAHSTEYRQWLRQEEYNPYLKNSWLLMGKAYVENGDYNEALSVFVEIQRIYPSDIDLISETQLWMLRSYVALNRMYDANNMIYLLQSRKLPSSLAHLYNQEYANYLLQNNEFEEAIPFLTKTIKSEKIYLHKKRLQFLLGQVYILIGDKEKAYNIFKKIKSLNTPPLLNKNASIYQAIILNDKQQNKFYNDSLAQIISHNIQPRDINDFQTNSTSANIYSIQSIVRERTYTPTNNLNTNRSETSILLDLLMKELNELNELKEQIERNELNQLNELKEQIELNSESESLVKTVPLKPDISTSVLIERDTDDTRVSPTDVTRESPAELKLRLERNAEEALKRSTATSNINNREQLLREREKQREARIKEREKQIKERERIREAQLKQREKERKNRIRKQK